MALPNFQLRSTELSALFFENEIHDFESACAFVKQLPYGRNADRTDLTLVLKEGKGTCSSKHGLLAKLCEENDHFEIELIAGIFLMSPETHPFLADLFKDKPYTSLPEMHCYFRFEKQRYDLTSMDDKMPIIETKIIREQRIEPHQVGDWKVKIHQEYIKAWLLRNPQIEFTFEEIWQQREEMIKAFHS
jgi:hypothetical protein